MPGKRSLRAAALAAGLALGACASTRIVESWMASDAEPLRFGRVLALALVEDESLRRRAEDSLQADLWGTQAVQSYKVLGAAELDDSERVKERLREGGFDGVVALRLVSSQQELSWMPSTLPVETFWGFYGTAYPAGELDAGTIVRVEIDIYSLADDKLVWAGVSETYDPGNAGRLVDRIVAAAGKELRKQGLIS